MFCSCTTIWNVIRSLTCTKCTGGHIHPGRRPRLSRLSMRCLCSSRQQYVRHHGRPVHRASVRMHQRSQRCKVALLYDEIQVPVIVGISHRYQSSCPCRIPCESWQKPRQIGVTYVVEVVTRSRISPKPLAVGWSRSSNSLSKNGLSNNASSWVLISMSGI